MRKKKYIEVLNHFDEFGGIFTLSIFSQAYGSVPFELCGDGYLVSFDFG